MVFSPTDWIIIIFYLLLLLWMGFQQYNKNNTARDYILGDGHMHPFMVGVSLFATLFSTLSYLSYPGEMIQYGPVFLAGILAFPLSGWVVGKLLIPRLLKSNVNSAYEILEIKVGKGTRKLAVLFFLFLRLLWMTTIMYATVDTALIPIIGIDRVYVPVISIVLSLLTALYTTIGGYKTVIKTDFIQSVIMFLGLLLVIGIIMHDASSMNQSFDQSLISHWQPFRFKIDPLERMTLGNIIIMTFTWQVCTAGSDQMAIQRYLSTGNVKRASKSYYISLVGSSLIQLLLALAGMAVLVYFSMHPDLLLMGISEVSADALFPLFIRVGLPVGFTGLMVTAIMGAAMSSISSGLNSSSTVILEDIMKRKADKSEIGNSRTSELKLIQIISFAIGIIVALLSFFIPFVTGNLFDVIQKVVNLVVSPLFVLFFMALFIPFSTDRGAMAGGVISLIVAVMVAFFEIFGVKSLWIMPASLITGITSGIVLSFVETKRIGVM